MLDSWSLRARLGALAMMAQVAAGCAADAGVGDVLGTSAPDTRAAEVDAPTADSAAEAMPSDTTPDTARPPADSLAETTVDVPATHQETVDETVHEVQETVQETTPEATVEIDSDASVPVLSVTVAPVDQGVVGATSFASSTQLAVHIADSGSAHHYRIVATDASQGTTQAFELAGTEADTFLTGLRVGTTYAVTVDACADAACASGVRSASGSGATSAEVWQIGGSGASFAQAATIVTSGATLSYGLRFGADAPDGLAGVMQLYYNPKGSASWTGGARIAASAGAASSVANLTAFTPLEAGLEHACPQPSNASSCFPGGGAFMIQASQPVPIASEDLVRLYFEATDVTSTDKTTRIYALDSVDGLVGRDFDTRAGSTVCSATGGKSDYANGGPCEPTLVIDAGAGAATGLRHARQFRIGMPREGWTWDMAAGSFMVITGADNCGLAGDNALFHARWDGSSWDVTKDGDGCAAPIATLAQGPTMLQTGPGEHKLYYRDESAGKQAKKTRVAYIRADVAGDPAAYELEDWEPTAAHREIVVVWPSGAALSASEYNLLGDYFVHAIDGDLERQLMFVNLGNPSAGLGFAELLNP